MMTMRKGFRKLKKLSQEAWIAIVVYYEVVVSKDSLILIIRSQKKIHNRDDYPDLMSWKIALRYIGVYKVQLRAKQTARSHISYANEVTLRERNPPLKCCQPLDFLCTFLKSLDLLLLKIWSL